MEFSEMFDQIATKLAESGESCDDFARAYHQFQDRLEGIVLPAHLKTRQIELRGGAQSKQYMVHLLPHIHRYMRRFPARTHFSILDVGPGAGFGSNLLGSLYSLPQLGYTAAVDTTDITQTYIRFAKVFCRHIIPHQIDIFALKKTYDIVIASHVLEHVPAWREFVRRLRELSKGIVVVSAPLNEEQSRLCRGHVNIFTMDDVNSINPASVELVESPAWGQFRRPPYSMFIATLKGAAVQGVTNGAGTEGSVKLM
jgi:SAM-dependent methyltransferase